jgi:putative endonuclease
MNQAGAVWTVYVLRSLKNGWLYIGMTNDIDRRLREHNRGYNRSTKGKGPFELVHTEMFSTRAEARVRERQLKTGTQRERLRLELADARDLPAGSRLGCR